MAARATAILHCHGRVQAAADSQKAARSCRRCQRAQQAATSAWTRPSWSASLHHARANGGGSPGLSCPRSSSRMAISNAARRRSDCPCRRPGLVHGAHRHLHEARPGVCHWPTASAAEPFRAAEHAASVTAVVPAATHAIATALSLASAASAASAIPSAASAASAASTQRGHVRSAVPRAVPGDAARSQPQVLVHVGLETLGRAQAGRAGLLGE